AEDPPPLPGLPAPALRLYPIETHVAEKLHAYTLPRARPNSRVKDLPDLALLASVGPLDPRRLRAASDKAFAFRSPHAPPAALPDPPVAWAKPYAQMAEENRLLWATLAD